MRITRRVFLKLIAAAAAVGNVPLAFSSTRDPYVRAGECVNYIGRSPGGFIGSVVVHEVGEWDGAGYPVRAWVSGCYGSHKEWVTYYDHQLCNFLREVPPDFWHRQENWRYPNIHTWVRIQRYGETMDEAIKNLNFHSSLT